jgi:Na+/H+ antiporter NhaC
VARSVARAIGWLFVAVIGYHAARAWGQTGRAVSDGNWGHAAELAAIALLATFVVVAAIAAAARSTRARR